MSYEAGARVVIRKNPHHPHAVNIVGTVVKLRPGEGAFGTDLVEVSYEDPDTGWIYSRPLGMACIEPGTQSALWELAGRYAALAAEMRRLADEAGDEQPKPPPAPKRERPSDERHQHIEWLRPDGTWEEGNDVDTAQEALWVVERTARELEIQPLRWRVVHPHWSDREIYLSSDGRAAYQPWKEAR